ncbi:GNAT family N-acetyltransferase [Chitinophaga sancti]|uniref:Acetyltransferase (GNAT) domain-containing protein n=1 Tax=Chitinophaga sancti TaxID=1004 RepID=A0A1K1S7L0_9BACT|nr:GNAT family N-acetyltransferase [Chitinophaga sancti]WQD62188.1 GNAT family N-acetyltransferase [Chitinophaga sancti]WQG92243.1 GNAT family N-acetyltransferase [Chitinophaga sancti]SFW80005.1 Acetyltransferase (GNAT) domain-containing protein [Chitinophaga sancti]
MHIQYKNDTIPATQDIIALYDNAVLNRPTEDRERIARMYENSNLVISAWDGDRLVGVARSLTDYCFCCYLSDLAVNKDYQAAGIGKQLVALTQEAIGPQTMLLLLSAPTAMEYYPKIGMTKLDNAFYFPRKQ